MKDEIIKHWFKNHKKEIYWTAPAPIGQGDMEFMRWGSKGTCIFRIDYLRLCNRLFVCGDLGEAIYGWSESKPLEWMAGLNLDYFASKCQASEVGRDYYEWSEERAAKYLKDYCENWDNPKEREERVRDLGGFSCLYSEHEFVEWLGNNGYEAFGDEYYDLGRAGRKINSRCQSHLIGLKMAFNLPLEYVGK